MILAKNVSWSKFLKDLKVLVIKSIPKNNELRDCIVDELLGTDEFHPSDCEYDLNELLKERFETLEKAKKAIQKNLSCMTEEIQTKIQDYYGNSLNFDPDLCKDIVKIRIKFYKTKPAEIKSLLKYFNFY